LFGFQINAQKQMTKGYIKMELSEATSDDEQMAMGLEMLKGTETNYYFDDQKSLVAQSMMGGMVEVSTISYLKDKSIEMYFNMMGNKTLVKTSEAELEGERSDEPQVKDLKININKDITKTIADFNCHQATISNSELTDQDVKISMFVTEDIVADNNMIQSLREFDFKGFPLEFTIEAQNMKMVYTTTLIEENFDSKVFEIDASGYTKMTMKEFQNQMGNMGGMGF